MAASGRAAPSLVPASGSRTTRCRTLPTGKPRTVTDESDGRDPLRAAFEGHQRAPRDIVPHSRRSVDDLTALAGSTVTVRHYELTSNGVREYTEQIEICTPITPEDQS